MKIKLILFIISLVGLILFQSKVVMPYVYDVASSDLFLEDTGDEANRLSESSEMTNTAFNQCNTYIAKDYVDNHPTSFSEKAINAFSLGGFQYVINADIEISPADAATFSRRYVCRIKYLNNSDNADTSNPDNWSIEGISGLDNIG